LNALFLVLGDIYRVEIEGSGKIGDLSIFQNSWNEFGRKLAISSLRILKSA
jgi:hypothetical protein